MLIVNVNNPVPRSPLSSDKRRIKSRSHDRPAAKSGRLALNQNGNTLVINLVTTCYGLKVVVKYCYSLRVMGSAYLQHIAAFQT